MKQSPIGDIQGCPHLEKCFLNFILTMSSFYLCLGCGLWACRSLSHVLVLIAKSTYV